MHTKHNLDIGTWSAMFMTPGSLVLSAVLIGMINCGMTGNILP